MITFVSPGDLISIGADKRSIWCGASDQLCILYNQYTRDNKASDCTLSHAVQIRLQHCTVRMEQQRGRERHPCALSLVRQGEQQHFQSSCEVSGQYCLQQLAGLEGLKLAASYATDSA